MKRLKNMVVVALAAVVTAAYTLVPALPAAAASSSALSIEPKKNYVIEPGKSAKDKITIRNMDTKVPLDLSLRVVDFSYTDDGGSPKLFLDNNAEMTTWSLRPFLKIPDHVTIDPGQSKTIDMDIAIPAGHGAGSYYSAIVYSSGAPALNGGNVGLNASGVTLAFVNVPGKVKEDLKLEKFGAYHDGTQGRAAGYSYINADEPQKIGYTLKNSGNVVEAPVGSITLKDLFGRKTTIDNVNPNGSLALIGQTRTFTSCIKTESQELKLSGSAAKSLKCVSPALWPGYYSVSLDLFYGQNGNTTQEITKTGGFWYLPMWFVLIVIVLLS